MGHAGCQFTGVVAADVAVVRPPIRLLNSNRSAPIWAMGFIIDKTSPPYSLAFHHSIHLVTGYGSAEAHILLPHPQQQPF
jgi:hypothetical protein